jgi:hypothetical protein
MNWILRLAARALEPGEREGVLGDLAEQGSPGARPLFDILGLVVRRQLLIWTSWQPWFALIGIIGVSGFYLSGMLYGLSVGIFEQAEAWRRYGVHYNTGVTSFREDVIQMSCLAAAIFFWTAVNASLLRRLSGRATWLTGLLFYIVVHDSSAARFVLSGAVVARGNPPWWAAVGWILPLNLESLGLVVFLFVIPAICGATGILPAITPATVLCTLAAALFGGSQAHNLQSYSNGEFPAASWLTILAPYTLVSWPILVRHRLFQMQRSRSCRVRSRS